MKRDECKPLHIAAVIREAQFRSAHRRPTDIQMASGGATGITHGAEMRYDVAVRAAASKIEAAAAPPNTRPVPQLTLSLMPPLRVTVPYLFERLLLRYLLRCLRVPERLLCAREL